MAHKNSLRSGKNVILAQAVLCAIACILPCETGAAVSERFAPASYVGSVDPSLVWEALIGGIIVAAFVAAIAVWIHSALRTLKRSQARRSVFISSALNQLNQGVVMTDREGRIIYCNDRYLRIYAL